MKLMKKVRKLSKVLGEVPVPAAVEEEFLPPPPLCEDFEVPGSPKMRSAAAKKAFRRSLTFGQSAGAALLETHDVQRAKSFNTLRPSLHVPRRCPSNDTLPTPSSPITFARPESLGSTQDVSECGAPSSAPPHTHGAGTSHGLKRRDSTASSVLLADQNTEQLQRTRVAKLSRHFGTNIPSEVLFRATSPPPASPPALYPLPTKVLSSDQLPRRSTSLRRRPTRRRPASLDIRPVSGLMSLPNSPPGSPVQQTRPGRRLKRSRSLWSRRPREDAENTQAKDEGEPEINLSQPMSLSEKQRALNVRRARKMAQLFGDNPPTALFQITNFGSALVEDGDGSVGHLSSDGHRYERDSLATIISISTTSLSATGKSKLRDSFVSVITTSSDVSGLILTQGDNEAEAEAEAMQRSTSPESEDITSQAKTLAVPILSPLPLPSRRTVRPRTSSEPRRSSSPLRFNRNLSVPQPAGQTPRTPPTPPPFSDLASLPAMRPATAPPASPAPSEFQTRRRRAAKLSKFFGVEVNALAEALPTDRMPSISSRKTSMAQDGPRERSLSGGLSHQTSVMVAEARRRRFLGMNDDEEDVEERDLSEVIDQLRKLRS